MRPKDNVEELEDAGVLTSLGMSDELKKKINNLSPAEVKHLKSSRKKVSDGRSEPGGNPWIL